MSDKHAPGADWPAELSLDANLGPAPYLTRAKADAIIAGALAGAGFAEGGKRPGAPSAAAKPNRRWAARASAAAALLFACLAVGSASAAVLWYAREIMPNASVPSFGARARRAGARAAVVASRAPAQTRETAPTAPPSQVPVGETARALLPSEAPAAASAEPVRAEPRAPEDWLVEGNRLRAEKRWHKAEEAYAQALRSSPKSQTAYVARVASAAVRLEHMRDPRGALALYRAALRQSPHGPLSEEIRFGLAESYRQLGDSHAERRALEAFLREHPRSPLVEQAKARLE